MTMQPSKWIPRIEAAMARGGQFTAEDRSDAANYCTCVAAELAEGINLGFSLVISLLGEMDMKLAIKGEPYVRYQINRLDDIRDLGYISLLDLAIAFCDAVYANRGGHALAIAREMRGRGHRYRKEALI